MVDFATFQRHLTDLYSKQQARLEQLLDLPDLASRAFEFIKAEEIRGIPLGHRYSFETQLEKAAFCCGLPEPIDEALRLPEYMRSELGAARSLSNAQVEAFAAKVRSDLARSAASAPRIDLVNESIVAIIGTIPRISEKLLLRRLQELVRKDDGRSDGIVNITETTIFFRQRGLLREAKVSGLKDRLSRCKKILASSVGAN